MPQTLYVKTKSGSHIEVTVLRSWSDISGKHIFLHAHGLYGYKDGSPVRNVTEFDIIGDQNQRRLAVHWWERIGKEYSARYYEAEETRARERIGDFRIEEEINQTVYDAVLYARRPAGIKKGAVSAPRSWMEWFAKRPDWWAQAKKIEFLDYVYEMLDEEAGKETLQAPGTSPGPDPDARQPLPKDAYPPGYGPMTMPAGSMNAEG